jgi:23S rRNA (cytosine1962-C5)-methyltransferase
VLWADNERVDADRRRDISHHARVDDYELLDVGGGARLERFGAHITDRPHGGALAARRHPAGWSRADLRFDRDRGWSGPGLEDAGTGWSITLAGLSMRLRPTDAGQLGVFPEHAASTAWLGRQTTERGREGAPLDVLNLFAYTGLATLALATSGARVTHVDAARASVAWARENAERNALQGQPIRWIVDDARAYTGREMRRGRRYAGIVMDPPTYGHGPRGGVAWRLDRDLPDLIHTAAGLLAPQGFIVVTAHTEGYGRDRLATLLADAVGGGDAGGIESGDIDTHASSGAVLRLGAFARLDGRVA